MDVKAFSEAIATKIETLSDQANKGFESVTERLEALEAQADRPKAGAASKEEKHHLEAFKAWLRQPRNDATRHALAQAEADFHRDEKTVQTGSGAAGGFAVPAEIDRRIEHRVRQLNPFRRLANVTQIGSGDFAHLIGMGDGASGWAAELGSRLQTTEPTLRERKPTMGTVYSYPWASEESVQDIFFDVADWLVTEASDEFAAEEATAIISGNGTNRPTGFLDITPVSTTDDASPLRAAGALQYIPGGDAGVITADGLIDLSLSIKERYLADQDSVAFVMSRATLAAIRKLKSSGGGDYLWQPSLAGGTPSTLLGYPVYTCDAMPAVGANAHPIAFGNWRRGYLLVDRTQTRITVDDNISAPGVVKFYVRRRVGGCILNNDALKVLKIATS
jgi:HK97 family phage major capsid protein